ncbi:hypothetical protein, partial [Acidovorax sp. CCYZU-2555]|uniref:hypothetical protein n=1 Tax=Acidovorax sp. CCYZU-2555 TaxID=2835042 RepID=UPI001BD08177
MGNAIWHPCINLSSISMYIFNSLWNSTVAYFQPAVKYCEEHKINRTTIGNVANDIGFIVVEGTKLAVSNAPPMAFQALATGGRAMLDLSHAALTSVHAWQFGSAGQNPQKSSATMVIDLASAAGEKLTELPGAAGEKLQDLSHSALKS